MAFESTAAGESEILAAALRAYLSETRFSFTGLTGKEATRCITRAVAEWAGASGWRSTGEAPMRYIDPPRLLNGGCRMIWSPSWSAYLDLRLVRQASPSVAVEIDRADDGREARCRRCTGPRPRPVFLGALRHEDPTKP